MKQTKSCPFSLKIPMSILCQKSRDSTANHIFFLEAKTRFLISKCMFNGHRTIEHEENV